MVHNQKSTPVGAIEVKGAIYRKIGPQRANNYFDLLKRFLSLKLEKGEFDKSCVQIIGRDILFFHNQLIRTILTNSCVGEFPLSRAKNMAVVASHNVIVTNALPVKSSSQNEDHKFCDRKFYHKGAGESLSSGTQQKFHPLTCQQTRELPDTRSLMFFWSKS